MSKLPYHVDEVEVCHLTRAKVSNAADPAQRGPVRGVRRVGCAERPEPGQPEAEAETCENVKSSRIRPRVFKRNPRSPCGCGRAEVAQNSQNGGNEPKIHLHRSHQVPEDLAIVAEVPLIER